MRQGSPYAIPSITTKEANTSAVLAEILRSAFEQSGTRIKDHLALDSAARHIAQSKRLRIELDNDQQFSPWPRPVA
jgi:hypothetical protein